MGLPRNRKSEERTATGPEAEGKAAKKRGGRASSKARLVSKVIRKIEKKLESDELKPTVGDFIRLLQLKKELDDEQPREIKVSWVEPEEKEPASQEQ